MPAYLITGATGQQGSGAVHALLAQGATVHALTRNASSPAAQALKARGAKLFEGSFDNAASLAAALEGVSGVFLNVLPFSETGEVNDAKNILAAAKTAGVSHVVYGSVVMADWADDLVGEKRAAIMPEKGFQTNYWADKSTIEKTVQNAGFKYWTVLRPGFFYSGLLNVPNGAFYPKPVEGKDYTEFKVAFELDRGLGGIHPDDIGKVIAASLLAPEHWTGRTVDLVTEDVTFRDAARKLEKIGGKKIVITGYSDEEKANAVSDPFLETQLVWNQIPLQSTDFETMKKEGFQLRTLEEYLVERKEDVRRTLGVTQ